MSVHVGWPDLSNSRRRSLCDFIGEVKSRIASLDLLEICLKEMGKTLPQDTMSEHEKLYQQILQSAELQFPEIRIDRDGNVNSNLQRSNQSLCRGLRHVDDALAMAIGCHRSELLHYYQSGNLPWSLAKSGNGVRASEQLAK